MTIYEKPSSGGKVPNPASEGKTGKKALTKPRPLICAYYFPNWHQDPRNDIWHGTGWTEWNVVKHATPRFPGHRQPKVPLWGYEDESDSKVMEKKIKEASSHGIDGFIFDWYWYDDGPFRIKCINEGFLKAANTNDMKFAIMWCIEDFFQVHPVSRMNRKHLLKSGLMSPQIFLDVTDYCINNYFNQPNYLRIDGGLYFSIYAVEYLVKGLGGDKATGELMRGFRKRAFDAGLGEININVIAPGGKEQDKVNSFLKTVGIDSCTSYVWNMHVGGFPQTDYEIVADAAIKDFKHKTEIFDIPYHPVVCMGWDPSPRTVQSEIYENVGYPYTPVIVNNTPANFGKALESASNFIRSDISTGSMVNISCWNEWTEGNYLEPDTEYGYGYLDEVKRVFGK